MIKTIIFDFGGVICTLNHPEAIRRFRKLGLKDAEKQLDAYTQGGIFGMIEEGRIDEEGFRAQLSTLCGRELTWDDCRWAWLGYRKEVPARNVEILNTLRRRGYRLVMLSNTNPYMMSWAMSPDFSKYIDVEKPDGEGVDGYFDAIYLSYNLGVMKPDTRFFSKVLEIEGINPDECIFIDDGPRNIAAANSLGIRSLQPKNGEDWTADLEQLLQVL